MLEYKLFLIDGLYFELLNTWEDKKYTIKMLDGDRVIYEINLTKNMWAKANQKYMSDYYVEVWDGSELKERISFKEHLKGKRVFISFESSSLGDGIAWMPYCLEFKNIYQCDVIVSTFHNFLYQDVYPELEFVGRAQKVDNIISMLKVGWYYDDKMEPEYPSTIPLQKAAANILHVPFEEIQTRIAFVPKERPIEEKYITIATESTAQCKHWYYWQELIDHLVSVGYKVVEISKVTTHYKNLHHIEDKSLENTMNIIHHSELLIGLSSGLSWLAWGIKKRVVMIANFTEASHEFTSNCIRITNTNVCNSCWNNPNFKFDKGDWNWCPIWKNTPRHFECHKSITAQQVIDHLIQLLPQ